MEGVEEGDGRWRGWLYWGVFPVVVCRALMGVSACVVVCFGGVVCERGRLGVGWVFLFLFSCFCFRRR